MFGTPAATQPLSLALQGGGAHGAYTWGVLDALLEHSAHPIRALSGTSAGAVNAAVLAHGWIADGRDGARAALSSFWQGLGQALPWDASLLVTPDGDRFTPAGRMMMMWAGLFSPRQMNPLRVDPLRDLLQRQVDFERLRGQSALTLFIAATHANSGRLRLFRTHEVTVDAVMASACLPSVQRAVEIDGEPYWDGGYCANPALFPLVHEVPVRDILVVMLSPWTLGDTPQHPSEIRARGIEISFNAAFLREMHGLAETTTIARASWWPGALERRLRRLRWHLIDGHDDLSSLPEESRMLAHPQLLLRLRDAGRARALGWLQLNGKQIGRAGSADLHHLFGHYEPPPRQPLVSS